MTNSNATASAGASIPREWFRISEAGDYCRVNKRTIFRWLKDETKHFPRPVKFGQALMFNVADVRQWADSHREVAA